MSGLEARYRRLLLAYPKRYRTDRGLEMLTTLIDGARPGQTRPTWQETRDLVLGGLRCRLRMPRRGVAAFAAFVALGIGTLGAATGATVGWLGVPPVPAEVRQALVVDEAIRDSGAYVFGTDIRVAAGRPDYLPDWSSATVHTDRPDALVAASRDYLANAGWRVEPRSPGFEATKRDVTVRVEYQRDAIEFSIDRSPRVVWILGLTGAVLAAFFAWLLTGYVARRALAAAGAIQSTITVLAVFGIVALLLAQVDYVRSAVVGGYLPGWSNSWPGTIVWLVPVAFWVVGLGSLLLALLVARASAPATSQYASGSTSTTAKR